MSYGYMNKVLRLDLAGKTSRTEPLRMDWAKKYIGSKGLALKYMYEELAPGIDPLGPANHLYLTNGPITGTAVPLSGKLSIAAKSPATGTVNDCSIGGHIALKIKLAGYDMVVLEGQLDKPGIIIIDNDKITFESADGYWGRGSHEVESELIKKFGREFSMLSIGQGGENLVPFACINSDYYRQAGRGGIGAVMGSKRLKAILVRGTGSVDIPNIKEATRRFIEMVQKEVVQPDNTFVFDQGTFAFLEACQEGGILPHKNFSDATDPEHYEQYSPEALLKYRKGKRGCAACAAGCGNYLQMGDVVVEGPEYETLAAAGPNCGIYDPALMIRYNKIVDDMGLDSISCGDTIAWAMEMTEKGVHDFGIKFGDAEKLLEYTKLIALRQGVGADLALGVKAASEKFGGVDFAMHCKGLEFPQYEPRGSFGMSMAYAVSDRGACHMRAYAPDVEVFAAAVPPYVGDGKGEMVKELAVRNGVKFSLCLCDCWFTVTFPLMAELMTLTTGETWTEEQLKEVGRRVLHVARAFNGREGFDRSSDKVPRRLFDEAIASGPAKGQKIPEEVFEDMLTQYYTALGWNEDGTVPAEILADL